MVTPVDFYFVAILFEQFILKNDFSLKPVLNEYILFQETVLLNPVSLPVAPEVPFLHIQFHMPALNNGNKL